MNFRNLTILTFVFMTSGVVGLITPENLLAWENPKRWRESREILKILQFQKELKKKHPETFQKRDSGKSSDPTKIRIRALSGSAKGKTLTLSNTSIQFLWGSWGIGQTTLKFEKSKSGKEFSISKEAIVGHVDIAPSRKTDPGPYFAWDKYTDKL